MAKNTEGRFCSAGSISVADFSISLLRIVSIFLIFVAGIVIGLVASSHIDRYLIYRDDPYSLSSRYAQYGNNYHPDYYKNVALNCGGESRGCLSIDGFVSPRNLTHTMSDEELFWRASMVPQKEEFPFKRVPKVAFMFMTRGPMPMLPLWERFFKDQDVRKYSIYVHARPRFELNVSESSVFFRREIPSQKVEWGSVSLVDAEKRLLANALLDFSNERFVLLSEKCIPVHNFPTVYRYLTNSQHSFVESYDDPSRYGRGRYSRRMLPDIHLREWRKGSQWFEMHRTLAVKIISDTNYYILFKRYCKPSCYPDEHYIPTYLNKFYGSLNSNRTVTYVDWSMIAPHPASFTEANATAGMIESIRNNGTSCSYNSERTEVCYLFARKFESSALSSLLSISTQVMGY